MATINPIGDGNGGGSGGGGGTKTKPKKPRKPRGRKAKKPKKPAKWREAPGAGSAGKTTSGAVPGRVSVAVDAGQHLLDLDAGVGLGSAILELIADGKVTLARGLAAWQREQERITNRQWRRPGGMARLAGL